MADRLLKTILVDLIPPRLTKAESLDRLQELEELVRTYGGIVVVKTHQRRAAPHPATFLGTGKIEQLAEEGKRLGAALVVINDRLKPRQVYLLSEALRPAGLQVWDRLDLILKIFAKHARTTEARLEIELAGIRHMGPRIYGMGLELSRQGGGTGTRGKGETNTEIMRRHLRERAEAVGEKLARYQTMRRARQERRRRQGLPTAALVGYTNAGKTSLLNRLTRRREYAADELFATLDTRVGSLYVARKENEPPRQVLVSDTIGFIQNLPPELLNAFASTLSEAADADVLVQVVDAADAHAADHLRVVDEILKRLGAAETPRVLAVNKIDAAGADWRRRLGPAFDAGAFAAVAPVSAATGQGMEALAAAIARPLVS